MNLKKETTRKVLDILMPSAGEEIYQRALTTWWANIRQKPKGGLKLTDLGYKCLIEAGIKEYQIKLDNSDPHTNQLIIWLDHFIDCPYYLTRKEICVFSERMAIQLVLFSGNIEKFCSAKAKAN
jgi:hypothetical protein